MARDGGNVHGFAVVGCGVIGATHARAIAALSNARLVTAVDVDDRVRGFCDRFGGDPELDLERALARPDVDVVSVCVPSGLHAEIGVLAAEAGKHVLVEKPIDITLEAADRLIGAAGRAGVTLSAISQNRFRPGVRRLHELIQSGRLGRLTQGDAVVKWYRTQEYYDSGDWRGTWALDGGGCLMNQGIHSVDLLQWLVGPVESLVAQVATAAHRIEVEDTAQALLRFRGGALGVLEGSTAVYPGLPERLEISGDGGTAILEAGELAFLTLKDEDGEVGPYGAKAAAAAAAPGGGVSPSANPGKLPEEAHVAQIADLLDAIESGRDPLVTGAEGRKPLEIILAVYRSAREGRRVDLPLGGPA